MAETTKNYSNSIDYSSLFHDSEQTEKYLSIINELAQQKLNDYGYTWSIPSFYDKGVSSDYVLGRPAPQNDVELDAVAEGVVQHLGVPPDGLVDYDNCFLQDKDNKKLYYNVYHPYCSGVVDVNYLAREVLTEILKQYSRDYRIYDLSFYKKAAVEYEASDYIFKEGGTLLGFIQKRSNEIAASEGFEPYVIEQQFLDNFRKIPKFRVKSSYTTKDTNDSSPSGGNDSPNYLMNSAIGIALISLISGGYFLWKKLFSR